MGGRNVGFGSGSGSKFNCAARVGLGQTISGTGFNFKPVQTSSLRGDKTTTMAACTSILGLLWLVNLI